MPRVSWDGEADWTAHYDVRVRNPDHPQYGQRVGYGRVYAEVFRSPLVPGNTEFTERRDHLIALGMAPTDRILVAGCAFGFLIEAFHDAGYDNVWGVEYSTHIENNRATESRGDVLFVEDDIRGGGRVRAALRNLTGDDEFDWIVSESVMESYDPGAEMDGLLNAAETVLTIGKPQSNIVHLVMDVMTDAEGAAREPRDQWIDPAFSQFTLAEWNAIRPAHTWMSYVTWQAL